MSAVKLLAEFFASVRGGSAEALIEMIHKMGKREGIGALMGEGSKKGKAEFTAKMQDFMCVMDTLIICRFTQVGKAVTVQNQVDWLNLITGRQVDIGDLMKTGERIFNLKRLYNTRLGVSRKDDFLPSRFMTLKRTGEGLTNQLPPIGQLLSDYYAYRRWTEDGIPTPGKLAELGLDQI